MLLCAVAILMPSLLSGGKVYRIDPQWSETPRDLVLL